MGVSSFPKKRQLLLSSIIGAREMIRATETSQFHIHRREPERRRARDCSRYRESIPSLREAPAAAARKSHKGQLPNRGRQSGSDVGDVGGGGGVGDDGDPRVSKRDK